MPVMDIVTHLVKYNAQTTGRDRLCRFFQYLSKFLWGNLQRLQYGKDEIQRLKNLETSLSSTRKVLRLGKSVDMVQGAIKSMTLDDVIVRLTLTISKLSQAFYLLLDHFVWISKIRVIKTDAKKWAKHSARFWLVGLICSIVRDIHDMRLVVVRELRKKSSLKKRGDSPHTQTNNNSTDANSESGQGSVYRVASENVPLLLDFLKNILDILLPLTILGYVKMSPGGQGLVGTITSFIGVLTTWNSKLKITPS